MIIGAHSMLYSSDAEADKAFLKDVLKLGHVDAGGGWLIFATPSSEMAVHPAAAGGTWDFSLMCDDMEAFVADMAVHGRPFTAPADRGWGVFTEVTLPSGAVLAVYEPRHARP